MRLWLPYWGKTPRGARLVFADGLAIPCDMLRDETLDDEDGLTTWVAVPRTPVPDNHCGQTAELKLQVLPRKTRVQMYFTEDGA